MMSHTEDPIARQAAL